MDGNGRWATERGLPRAAGHREGVKALRAVVEHSVARKIPIVTVFAFSSENWRRPRKEIGLLLDLFIESLEKEVSSLHKNGVSLRFVGERDAFPPRLRTAVRRAEKQTAGNTVLKLVIAANYGGRWDVTRACRGIAELVAAHDIDVDEIDQSLFARYLSFADLSEPDLFIRTGGEQRISNFLLWELAYTELYFTDVLWPDFGADALDAALTWYSQRQRRFGRTSDQVEQAEGA
ncbi:MAG: di-trans,poly-cis-decaprenylcistransferase [Gammaproteobacteria bacterium]|nr:di-trans,poly-cis-decaprenylcistransferase [Gammaproteobacteria bacterium]